MGKIQEEILQLVAELLSASGAFAQDSLEPPMPDNLLQLFLSCLHVVVQCFRVQIQVCLYFLKVSLHLVNVVTYCL
jgi:hypothetical protein